MRTIARIIGAILAAGVVTPAAGAPALAASPAAAPAADPGSIGIRLLDAPVARKDDPRAYSSIVDHLRPGSVIERRVEVSNTTSEAHAVALYAGPAEIVDGAFVGSDAGTTSELTDWVALSDREVTLAPGTTAEVLVRIAVPDDASKGERYGVVWASVASTGDGPVQTVNRVGVRLYLSVGPGGEPASDFEISSLTASRTEDGLPVVSAAVTNTGARALDMAGELSLTDGPGALTAGPFAAELGTTLAPGDTAPVQVVLDERLPDGPWLAQLELSSGTLTREAEATLTFPEPGLSADPVEVGPHWWTQWPVLVGLAIGLLVVLSLLLALLARRRRGDRPGHASRVDRADPTPPVAATAPRHRATRDESVLSR